MDPIKVKGKRVGPESVIQKNIIRMLNDKGWFVKSTHGNMFQQGFPDLWCCHVRYGTRWVEVKNPAKYAFTAAQLIDFREMAKHGVGVWVLIANTEHEYNKLFAPANWHTYLKI